MSQSSSTASGGIGLGTLVFIVFLVLKLAEVGVVAEWSWWWVTSPLWISVLLWVAVILGLLLFSGIAALFAVIFDR